MVPCVGGEILRGGWEVGGWGPKWFYVVVGGCED